MDRQGMEQRLSSRWQELFWALPPGEMRSKLRALESDMGRILRRCEEWLSAEPGSPLRLQYAEPLIKELASILSASPGDGKKEIGDGGSLNGPSRLGASQNTDTGGEIAKQSAFVDTPLLQAKRRAFDYPNQENLDALIAAAKSEALGHAISCASHYCGWEWNTGNGYGQCRQPRDSDIHYVGTVDSHAFVQRPCDCLNLAIG